MTKRIYLALSLIGLSLALYFFWQYDLPFVSENKPLQISVDKEKEKVSHKHTKVISQNHTRSKRTNPTRKQIDKSYLNVEDFAFEENPSDIHRKFVETVEIFKKNPSQIELIEKKIDTLDPKNENFMKQISYLTGLLAEQNAPQAEHSLINLIDTYENETIRIQAISALGDLRNVGSKAVSFLMQISQNSLDQKYVRDTADLNLGIIASRLRKQPEKADISDTISHHLNQAAKALDEHEQRGILDSLGNDGSTIHIPIIAHHLKSHDYIVRARAVYQLRKMPSETISPIILRLLSSEKTQFVWEESLKVISTFPDGEEKSGLLSRLTKISTNDIVIKKIQNMR